MPIVQAELAVSERGCQNATGSRSPSAPPLQEPLAQPLPHWSGSAHLCLPPAPILLLPPLPLKGPSPSPPQGLCTGCSLCSRFPLVLHLSLFTPMEGLSSKATCSIFHSEGHLFGKPLL